MIRLTLSSLLLGEYAAATVLISFCVLLGKLSVLQLITMAVLEVILYSINEYIGFSLMFAHDVGYTIFLHVFAAFFGLGVSRALKVENVAPPSQLATSKSSNIFSLLGTLFLWVFWPSFMASASVGAAPAESHDEHLLGHHRLPPGHGHRVRLLKHPGQTAHRPPSECCAGR